MKKAFFEMTLRRNWATASLGLLAIVLSVSPAFADLILTLNTPNAAMVPYTGPYAQVDISLTGQVATVTFTSLTNGGHVYLIGDGSSVALNINSASFTVTQATGTNPGTGFTPGAWSIDNPPGTSNVDGFGSFNMVQTDFDGFSHSAQIVTFTVTNTGTAWASAADVLTPNSNGAEAVAHIFVCNTVDASGNCVASGGALATGYAADGGTSVPEPSVLMLLGSGIAGFTYLTVRRRRSANS